MPKIAPTRSALDLMVLVAGPTVALAAAGDAVTSFDAAWRVFAGVSLVLMASGATDQWRRVALAVLLPTASVPIGAAALLAGLAVSVPFSRWTQKPAEPAEQVRTLTTVLAIVVGAFTLQDRVFAGSALLSAAIALAVLLMSALAGIRLFSNPLVRVIAIFLAALVSSTALYAVTMQRHATDLAAVINDGDLAITELSMAVEDASEDASRWYFRPLDVVPMVGRNSRAVRGLLASGSQLLHGAAQLSEGRSDPSLSSARLCEGVQAVNQEMADLADEELLLPQLHRIMDTANENRQLISDGAQSCPTFMDLAGMHSPKSYLVLFTSTAETRGTIGLVTNWAKVTIEAGHAEVLESGRSVPMNEALAAAEAELVLENDAEELWNRFNIERNFQDVTLSPDGVLVADAAQSLIAQVDPGWEPDGVVILGTRPIEVAVDACGELAVSISDDQTITLDGTTTTSFLEKDQYELDLSYGRRVEALSALLDGFEQKVGNGECSFEPSHIRDFAEAVGSGEIIVVPRDPGVRAEFDSLGLTGRLPDADETPLFGIVEQNAGLNKLDPYLTRSAKLRWPSASSTGASVEMAFLNDAPPALPAYVLGLDKGDAAPRVNRRRVSIYAPTALTEIVVAGGEVLDSYVGSERGHVVTTVVFDVPPGETVTVTGSLSEWSVPERLSLLTPATPQSSLTVEIDDEAIDAAVGQRVHQILLHDEIFAISG